MSYQFVNNWPSSNTVYPTMEDHIDPVNHDYFSGLHTELVNIELALGLNPADGFADIKHKLEEHDHTGGLRGALLVAPEMTSYPDCDFVSSWIDTNEIPTEGTCRCGFNYYDLIYMGPCERDSGDRTFYVFNTLNEDVYHQAAVGVSVQPRGAIVIGDIAYLSCGSNVDKIYKFNILTWAHSEITMGSGAEYPGSFVELGDYIYTPCYTTPLKLVRIKKSDDSVTVYDMGSGDNEGFAIITDGTYIWFCCNTNPVKLIRFNPADSTHAIFTLTGFVNEVKYMYFYDNMIYIFNYRAGSQIVRFNPTTFAFQLFTPAWPNYVSNGSFQSPYLFLVSNGALGLKVILFNLSTFVSYICTDAGAKGYGFQSTILNNYFHIGGTTVQYHNYLAHMSLP